MDTNIMILNILYLIASQVWAGFAFDGSGVYTAKDIAANKRGKDKLPIHYNYHDDYTDGDGYTFDGERFNVSVDSFTCAFPADQVFRLVARFETLAGIKIKDRVVYDTNEERPRACNLMIEMDKSASALAKCVSNDQDARSVYRCVYLDLNRGALVASDGHVLQAYPVRLLSDSNVDHDTPLLLPAALFKAYKGGPVAIGYDIVDDIARDIVCQYAGRNYKLAEGGCYSNWADLPMYDDTRLTFSKQQWASVLKAVKRMISAVDNYYHKIVIHGLACNQHISVSALTDDDTIAATVELPISNELSHNFYKALNGALLLNFKDCEVMYSLNDLVPTIIAGSTGIGLLTPFYGHLDLPNDKVECSFMPFGGLFAEHFATTDDAAGVAGTATTDDAAGVAGTGTTGEAVDTVGTTTTGKAVDTVGTTGEAVDTVGTTGEAVDTVGTGTTREAVDTVGTTTTGEAIDTVGTGTTGEAVDDVNMYQHTGYITPPSRFGVLVGMDLHAGYITPPPRFGMLVGMDLYAWCIAPPPRFGMLIGMDLYAWCITPPPRFGMLVGMDLYAGCIAPPRSSYLFGPPGGRYRPRGHPQPIGLYGQLVSAPAAAKCKNRYYRASQKSPDLANKARAGPGKTMGSSYYRGLLKS